MMGILEDTMILNTGEFNGLFRKLQKKKLCCREFLASVLKGQIPDELVKEARGGEVNVDMEDHREEEFVKPKVKAKPFQGAGNVLGSIAPSVAAPEANPSLDPAAAEKAAQQKVNLNESNPVANIQVYCILRWVGLLKNLIY